MSIVIPKQRYEEEYLKDNFPSYDFNELRLLVSTCDNNLVIKNVGQYCQKVFNNTKNSCSKIMISTVNNTDIHNINEALKFLPSSIMDRLTIKTFVDHAINMLKKHGFHIGLRLGFNIISDNRERIYLLKNICENKKIKFDNYDMVLNQIDNVFNSNLNYYVLDKKNNPEDPLNNLFYNITKLYVDELAVKNILDKKSAIFLSNSLLTEHEIVNIQAKLSYPFLCVPNFQMINTQEYEFLKLHIDREKTGVCIITNNFDLLHIQNDITLLETFLESFFPYYRIDMDSDISRKEFKKIMPSPYTVR